MKNCFCYIYIYIITNKIGDTTYWKHPWADLVTVYLRLFAIVSVYFQIANTCENKAFLALGPSQGLPKSSQRRPKSCQGRPKSSQREENIRKYDKNHNIFYEPLTWGMITDNSFTRTPLNDPKHSVYSYHYYKTY